MKMRRLVPVLPAAALGVLAAALVSCGSSGVGLIPAEDAGPLLSDFQAVEADAKAGNGSCGATEAALRMTERDFKRLPASVDVGLHGRLREGVSKLHELALEACAQPSSSTTATGESSTPATTAPPSSSTTATGAQTSTGAATTPAPTTGTGTTPSGTQTSGTEGGTAPGVGSGEGQAGEGGEGGGQGSGSGADEGAKNGGVSGGTGSGNGGGGGGGGQ